MHWSAHYVGQPYEPGSHDCAALAARVQREVFGRDITLPMPRAQGLRGQSQQILAHQADYARRVITPDEQPEEGDAVLMRGRGRLNHIGVYCLIDGAGYVLHAMRDAGSVCLHRLRDLPSLGLPVEGFYRWTEIRTEANHG